MPGAWLSPLHVCIVWCNQLQRPLARFLLYGAQQAARQALEHRGEGGPAAAAGGHASAGGSSAEGAAARATAAGRYADPGASPFLAQGRQELSSRALPQRLQALLDYAEPRALEVHGLNSEKVAEAGLDAAGGKTGAPKEAQGNNRKSDNNNGSTGGDQSPGSNSEEEGGGLAGLLSQPAVVVQQCKGGNLAWYEQYIPRPTLVTASITAGASGAAQGQQGQGGVQVGSVRELRLRGRKAATQLRKAGVVGSLYQWLLVTQNENDAAGPGDLVATSHSFSLVVSGSKPCWGWRVWVQSSTSLGQQETLRRAAAATKAAAEAAAEAQGVDLDKDILSPQPSSSGAGSDTPSPGSTGGEDGAGAGAGSSSSTGASSSESQAGSAQKQGEGREQQEQWRLNPWLLEAQEVTHLAAWLPLSMPGARRFVRDNK